MNGMPKKPRYLELRAGGFYFFMEILLLSNTDISRLDISLYVYR